MLRSLVEHRTERFPRKFFTMNHLLQLLVLSVSLLLVSLPSGIVRAEYDYVLGRTLTLDDVEPPDNYDLQVFMDEDEAVEFIFKDCDNVMVDYLTLSAGEKKLLEDRLKRELDTDSFRVFVGEKRRKVKKYAVITNENGCFHPMTFVTSVRSDGSIDGVSVMVYRESRGKEVTRKRFLRQFKGKSVESPIRVNKDIIHVTGATTSVRGINRGVRRAVAIVDMFYLRGGNNATSAPYDQSKNGGGAPSGNESSTFSHAYFALGDIVEIVLTDTSETAASVVFKDMFAEIKRLDKMLNSMHKRGELSLVNRKAGKAGVKCGGALFDLVESTLKYCEMSGGGLDVTEGVLANRLSKGRKKFLKPKYLNPLINALSYRNIILDSVDGSGGGGEIRFKEKLTGIDASAVAKGFVVDALVDSLRGSGVKNCLVRLGGNIRVIGNGRNGAGWTIAVKDPGKDDLSCGYVTLTDKAIAITGGYEKAILKTRRVLSALPGIEYRKHADTNVVGAVVVAPTAFEADALSALSVLSTANQGMKLINNMDGVEGISLYGDESGGNDQYSDGIKEHVVLTSEKLPPRSSKPACAY